MKKLWIMVPLVLLLWGCAAEETYETVADEILQPVMASPRQILVNLPDDAVTPVLEGDQEQVYLCEDYEIVLETLSAGDLSATVRHLSGYEKEELTVMQTSSDGVERYEFVWVSAGEKGDRIGRAVVLDDGSYHYCLSALRDADTAQTSQVVWSDVFGSFQLAYTDSQ